MRSLISELKKIHSREDLLIHAEKLEILFNSLVNIVIEAKKFKEIYPDAEPMISLTHEQSIADQLRIELNRILHMEGGREVMEKVQKPALERLDAKESLS